MTSGPEYRTLMVIVPDRPSEWIKKGEVIERYYNPGGLFEEVHLVLTNDDEPDAQALKSLVGDAAVTVHHLPPTPRLFRRSLGWRPQLLRSWASAAVSLARRVRPQLVRCHSAQLNAFAAYEIKRVLAIPYIVSLHSNPDEDARLRSRGRERLELAAMQGVERMALRGADLVLPVYQCILPYLERIGVERYQVAYNMLNGNHLSRKRDYGLGGSIEIISVGRQFPGKRPVNLLSAVSELPVTRLTLVGDGPDHELLRRMATGYGIEDRVTFQAAISNDELCQRLPSCDIFSVHSEYRELSKSVLEACITGLPIVLNRRTGAPVPELTSDVCLLVDNTVEGYRGGLERLIRDHALRRGLGQSAAARADREWIPEITEGHFVEIYRRLASGIEVNPATPGAD
jgi:glycosyltransferase involved in cell wall biosynthesis